MVIEWLQGLLTSVLTAVIPAFLSKFLIDRYKHDELNKTNYEVISEFFQNSVDGFNNKHPMEIESFYTAISKNYMPYKEICYCLNTHAPRVALGYLQETRGRSIDFNGCSIEYKGWYKHDKFRRMVSWVSNILYFVSAPFFAISTVGLSILLIVHLFNYQEIEFLSSAIPKLCNIGEEKNCFVVIEIKLFMISILSAIFSYMGLKLHWWVDFSKKLMRIQSVEVFRRQLLNSTFVLIEAPNILLCTRSYIQFLRQNSDW